MVHSLLQRCTPFPHSTTTTHQALVVGARVRVSLEFTTRARMGSSAAEAVTSIPSDEVLVQYVVLRRDLIDTWPLGSVVTQGCHASVSAIWSHKDDPHTLDYCSPTNLDSMHKASLSFTCYMMQLSLSLFPSALSSQSLEQNEVTLEVKGETQIRNLSEKLTAGDIAHKLWIEQPENIPTCLATKPYPKCVVSSFFKKLKLCK
ncbi:hypothetical protein ACSBR1_037237 [Camellia fascicularis]